MAEHSFFYLLLKTTLALAIVVLLIFALFFILKKVGYKSLISTNNKNNKIQILEKRFLAPKHYLIHVEWENYKFLISVLQNQLTVIEKTKSASANDNLPTTTSS